MCEQIIPSPSSFYHQVSPRFKIVLGVSLVAAGFFLILATHQILPHGVNAVSHMQGGGFWYGLLFCGIGLGIWGSIEQYKSVLFNSPALSRDGSQQREVVGTPALLEGLPLKWKEKSVFEDRCLPTLHADQRIRINFVEYEKDGRVVLRPLHYWMEGTRVKLRWVDPAQALWEMAHEESERVDEGCDDPIKQPYTIYQK
jgi:hypothetical protein